VNDKRVAWIVFAILFATFAYFYQGAGPNQNSRFDLVRAIVDRRTFEIDAYAKNTIDKSEANGHAYSDKAPGLAFASTPVYLVVRVFQGFATPSRDSARAALYLITIVVVGGASAAAGAFVYGLERRLGIGALPALASVLAGALGSNAFAYATLYVGHAFVGALLDIAFALLERAPGEQRRLIAIAGLLAGWAAISEYPAAALATFLFGYGCKRHGTRAMIPFVGAAAIPLVLLAVYNTSCFGSPFTLGYDRLASATYQTAMNRGLYGVTLPSPSVMARLLFSEHRGLLPLAPWFVLVVPGLVIARRRPEGWLVAACVVFQFLLASSYAVWNGGMAMGPRHFVAALPFAAIACGFALDALAALPRPRRVPLAALAGSALVYALVVCLACVAVMPEFVDTEIPIRVEDMRAPDPEHPLTTFVLPLLARGYVSVKGTTPGGQIGYAIGFEGHDDDAINLGERLGLHGIASLLPLVVLWLAGGIALSRARAQSER
jgi:hypothetical protein